MVRRALLFALTLFILPILDAPAGAAPIRLARHPDYHAGRVAFSYLGDIWTASEDGTGVQRITDNSAREVYPRFSPDGRWIAYASTESGAFEVYLVPYPLDRGPSRQQVSNGGGSIPQWAPDGRTIYYGTGDQIMRVRMNPQSGEIGNPELLRKIRPALDYKVAPDGRFLIERIDRSAESHSMKVVLNWASILDRKN